MIWRKDSVASVVSECGRFRINVARVNGELIYQAVRVIPQPSVIVLGRGTLEEAKRACEEVVAHE